MSLQRREFFAILGACAASAPGLLAAPDFASYRPQALTRAEYDLLDALSETLLPKDKTGPGAHDAHVAYYIDVVLKHAATAKAQSWRNGLAGVEALAQQRFHRSFTACSGTQAEELMAELAKDESAPRTELDHFFVEFKKTAIDAFYASALIQREHLGYNGNTAVMEFAGCTHPDFEHQGI
jgi:hypothetical protein